MFPFDYLRRRKERIRRQQEEANRQGAAEFQQWMEENRRLAELRSRAQSNPSKRVMVPTEERRKTGYDPYVDQMNILHPLNPLYTSVPPPDPIDTNNLFAHGRSGGGGGGASWEEPNQPASDHSSDCGSSYDNSSSYDSGGSSDCGGGGGGSID